MKTETKEFEPIILGLNENEYKNRISQIENETVRPSNIAIESIEELGLKLCDLSLKDFFSEGHTAIHGIIDEFFKDIPSKFERERLIKEYNDELESIYNYASNHRNYNTDILLLRFNKGRAEIAPEAKESLKYTFYKTLETERAKELHDLHDEVFQKTAKLLELLRQVTPLAKYHNLFVMDKNWVLKKPDLNYNKL